MIAPNDDNTQTHVSLTRGTMVQHYRIADKIGAGGMGEVYLADDTKLNRQVALKFLPSHLAQNPHLRTRFTREAQAAAKLDHPNIVTIHEVDEHDGRPFFAMQYIDGKTLHTFCHDEPLPVANVLQLIAQVADGLARAHAAGVVHRDIKSANIIVDSDLRPKILDFGLAAIQGGEMLTTAGSTIGTVAYMSPEAAQGRDVDHRSDLFSLGIVMYELLTGRTPFKRNHDAATLNAIINETPEPLSRYKSDITPELQRVVTKALAKNPAERYQSAADFCTDLRTICRSMDSSEPRTTGRVAVSRPSIAVLPFANMSADPENEYFSDGLTEELLNVLAKNAELKVTGRTSSFAFKGKQGDLREIGQKLGVQTLLEGSVRKAGNRVRITAQLVSAADGFHLWSETYDRVLDDIFAVQDDIAKAVSKAMHVTLVGVPDEQKAINPESYALTLRAQQSAQQMSQPGLGTAVELYQKAIDLDPSNVRAWAGLGMTQTLQIAYGQADYEPVYPKAKAAVERALSLDPALPEAHLARGYIYSTLELQFESAVKEYRSAYALAPKDSRIVDAMALVEAVFGRIEEGIRFGKLAVELDPLNPTIYYDYGRVLFWAGRLDDAKEILQRGLTLSPDIAGAHLTLTWICLGQGKHEEALSAAMREKLDGYRYCALAHVYHDMGREEEFQQALQSLIACGDQWGFQIANAYAYHGDADKAFEWLEKCWELRDSGTALTKIHPTFRKLHSDPRWPALIKKLGYPD